MPRFLYKKFSDRNNITKELDWRNDVDNNRLSVDFEQNISRLDGLLRVEESFDIIKKNMLVANNRIAFYYIDGFVNSALMQKLMMHLSTIKDFGDKSKTAAKDFADQNVPAVEVAVTNNFEQISLSVMSGCAAFFAEGFGANAIIIDVRTYPARETSEPENDKVMRGSRDGFVETLIFNTAMLRRRIRDPRLTVKYHNIGKISKTDIAICYLEGKADNEYVEYILRKFDSIECESIILGHRSLAEVLIKKKWYNPFPKFRFTERPDAAAASIVEGSVVVFCDNSPEAIILPTTIFDFLQESDDYYFPPLTGTYLRIVRHMVFWATMILTPLWYLLLSYEAVLPDWLGFIVPQEPGLLPIIVQLFLTEFVLDGLKLASLNTPSVLSNSLSVVGGLLLGDFAIQVGWLCPDVILYMAFVSIANFTQSSYELGYAFKYMRMITLFLTAIFKLWGFFGGILVAIVLVATNESVNGKRTYLYPLVPFNKKALARLFFRLKKND